MMDINEEIEHRFGYHRATFPAGYDPRDPDKPLAEHLGEMDDYGRESSAPRHAVVRQIFIKAAKELIGITPPSREQSLMLTKLQEAAMWANAGVAMESPLVRE